MSSQQPSGWEILPSQALLTILTPLDIISVRSCALVCHHWRAVADAPSLWKAFLARLTGGYEASESVEGDVVKAVTCRLYTWGGKVVEVPGTTLRNRLTSPTLVPRRMDVEEDVTGMMGLDGTYGDRSEVRDVAAGEDFCALLSWWGTVCDTRALERGTPEENRLGWASRRHLFVERWAPPGETITKVAAGGGTGAFLGGHVLAISSSGQVWSWGSNSHGQLGLGVVDDFVHHPEKAFEAAGTSKMVGAACGKFHSVVWSDDGVLYSCGDNSQGACSHPRNQKKLPVFLAVELPGLNVLHAACADANTIICTEIGHVWVVGDNSRSQCGPLAATSQNCFKFAWIDPKTSWNAPNRTRARDSHIVEKEVKIVQVAASSATLYALTNTGEVHAWGSGSQGELGTGGACKCQSKPCKLPWASKIKLIVGASGGRFAAAIDSHGRLYSWGEGKYGQLGHGDTNKRTTGRAVKSLYGSDVVTVACGSDFMMGVTSWKMWQKRKGSRINPSGMSRSFTVSSHTSCGSLEEEMLISSSGDASFRYVEIATTSSPFLSLPPSFPRRLQKSQRRLSVGQDLGADNMDGDISDKDWDISPSFSPSEALLVPNQLQTRGSRPHLNNENVRENSTGALPIPIKRTAQPLAPANRNSRNPVPRRLSTPELDRTSKKGKKNHAMLRRKVKVFANDPRERELFFPPELSSGERYKVHVAANQFGLSHESVGDEPNRQIRVWKPLHQKRPVRIPMRDYCGQTPEFDAITSNDQSSKAAQAIFESSMEL